MTERKAAQIRVLHVFGQMDRGGAEIRTMELMQFQDSYGYRLDFCALSGRCGDLDTQISEMGGAVRYCKLDFFFPVRFIKLVSREKYDVVHSHVLFVSGFILLLAFLARVPVRVAHFRSTGSRTRVSTARSIRDKILRVMIDTFATNILAVSEGAMKANWTQFRNPDERCRVIYNGIDVEPYKKPSDRSKTREQLGLPPEARVIVHIGRFSPPKNHIRLLSIFAAIHKLDPLTVLLLIGGGSSHIERHIRDRSVELGVGTSVVFCGLRSDIPDLLRAADVMVFPSLWEGLPGAVLEALAAGVPVVASDLPGVREIHQHISGVEILDLERSDEEWALAAKENMGKFDREGARELEQSVFGLERSVQALREVWGQSIKC